MLEDVMLIFVGICLIGIGGLLMWTFYREGPKDEEAESLEIFLGGLFILAVGIGLFSFGTGVLHQ